jgi:hypothetical protein
MLNGIGYQVKRDICTDIFVSLTGVDREIVSKGSIIFEIRQYSHFLPNNCRLIFVQNLLTAQSS